MATMKPAASTVFTPWALRCSPPLERDWRTVALRRRDRLLPPVLLATVWLRFSRLMPLIVGHRWPSMERRPTRINLMGRRALDCLGPTCRLGLVSDVFSRSRVCRLSPYHLAMPPRSICGAKSYGAAANDNPAVKGPEDPRLARRTISPQETTMSEIAAGNYAQGAAARATVCPHA